MQSTRLPSLLLLLLWTRQRFQCPKPPNMASISFLKKKCEFRITFQTPTAISMEVVRVSRDSCCVLSKDNLQSFPAFMRATSAHSGQELGLTRIPFSKFSTSSRMFGLWRMLLSDASNQDIFLIFVPGVPSIATGRFPPLPISCSEIVCLVRSFFF